MTKHASKDQLTQRRRQLRQQRRIRVVTSLWRFVCMSGILAGLVWVVNQSDWKISQPEQVQIQGNKYLSDQTIRSMLGISYPKLIMELAPEQLTAKLIDRGSISSAKIDRGLLPPHLTIQIQDLPPVARIMQDERTETQMVVNELGFQLPISSYQANVSQSLPKLQLIPPTKGSCPNWTQIYRATQASPVTISTIDCRNPLNSIVQTEIGTVRLGATGDNSRLTSQMQQLDRLRNWPKSRNPDDVDYLDLENPDSPRFQLKQPGSIAPKILLPK